MKLRILTLGIAVSMLSACGGAKQEDSKVLNVYNYSDYIAEDTIPNFEKATGTKVTYDVFDSDEMVETKLLAGNSGYDVVVPTLNFFGRQIQAGVFLPLDKSKIPNLPNLDPAVMKRIATQDPGNQYGVPYMIGTTGIGYNVDMLKERFGGSTDIANSWDLVFKPENLAKLKDCGVTFLDAASEIIPVTLHAMGEDPNSFDMAVIDKAAAKLESIRPSITNFHSSEYIDALASGNVCLVVGWSGDIIQAKARAGEAGNGVNIGYSIPKEGTAMWFDMMAIPKTAKHPGNAHKFLDYLMRPDVMAGISNYVSYPNANSASQSLVDKAITDDPMITPTKETIDTKLFGLAVLTPEVMKKYTDVWTELKTQ